MTQNRLLDSNNCLCNSFALSSSFERASTPGQTRTGLGSRVYPFTIPGCCAVLPGSNPGSDGVKPASSLVI